MSFRKYLHPRLSLALLVAACSLLIIGGLQAQTIPSPLVINEIDYDQPGTDAAEFVEIKNVGVSAIDLSSFNLVFINASVVNSAPYATIALPALSLAAGDYFVVCANAATVANCDLDGTPDTNFIQNGAPDAVALRMVTSVIDTVSYEGDTFAPYTEGSGVGLVDPADTASGISRFPDGADTNRNNVDLSLRCVTPGAANTAQNSNCGAPPVTVRIRDIQGASHVPPLLSQNVSGVPGIVTGRKSNGFFMQDPQPDANDATSEGIFVFTSSAPTVTVGDSVTVNGFINEFFLLTQISSPTVTVVSTGNALPAPVVLGAGGRVPPNTVIDDDGSTTFDAASDGLDFYESLEGMRVQVNNALVVGPTNNFGEIVLVGDGGANSSPFTARGGVYIQPTDFNPERIFLDDGITLTPIVNVGDRFAEPIIGLVDYTFDNYKIQVTSALNVTPGGLARETAAPPDTDDYSVATLNVENLSATASAAKFSAIAGVVVSNLRSPDIIALAEIQDNNGTINNGVVDASATYAALISAIQTAGGPAYAYREIAPENNRDGGAPGGNIRVAFLFNPARVTFIDRPGGTATSAVAALAGASGVELNFSPGRIAPTNAAFTDSRKPLAGEFVVNGRKLIVVANHFNSKGGDDPLFGLRQPPLLLSEAQRLQQAQLVNDFVDSVLALDPQANVVILGDLNDFQFSAPLQVVAGGVLTNLIDTLPPNEQYTYIFEGNSQVLDNLLISGGLTGHVSGFDVVHANAEFASAGRATDHDPLLARFNFAVINQPPVAQDDSASTDEDTAVIIDVLANDSDPEGALLPDSLSIVTPAANGTATVSSGVVNYAPNANFNGTDTFVYQVCDAGGACASATVTVTVNAVNDLPTLTLNLADVIVDEGATASNGGTAADVDGDPVIVSASFGDLSGVNPWQWSFVSSDGPAQSQTIIITADDQQGGVVTASFNLVVNNVPPTVSAGADVTVYRSDVVAFAGSFFDPGTADTHSIAWTFGDGGTALDTLTPTYVYGTEGMYTVTLTVTDKDGGMGTDDLLVTVLNRPPVCDGAAPSVASFWPPNHSMNPVSVLNIYDPEGDALTIIITSVFQDEPVNGTGDGDTSPDAEGVGTGVVNLRAERAGNGNGRVYHVSFLADDGHGGSCSGVVRVSVPQNQGKKGEAVDDGPLYDSTLP